MARFFHLLPLGVLLAAAPAPAGEKYALVVGVERYIPTELPSLTYAEDDAAALGRALTGLGFSVITMTGDADNPRHRPTTAARIVEQVEARLDDRAPDDTVVLAFSGHGLQFKGDREFYFCPGEAELRDRSSLVPMGRVMAEIGRCRAGRKLVLVDACRNELTPEAAAKSGTVIELEPAVAFRAQPPQGTIALFSCQPKEKSYELERLGHSVFTHHVLEYLTGRADEARYPRREVNVEELVPFVRARTRETASRILGATQRPEALVPEATIPDWPLGTLGDAAGAERGPPAARPRPFRHDAAESRRRVTAARRILAADLAGLRAELEKTPVPARGDDPRERERRMLAWALASLGDREGTLRHAWMPPPQADGDGSYRSELAEASVRTLGLLERRRPDVDVSQAVRKVFDAGGRYVDASTRERLRWAFLDADSFLPATGPAEQERQLALAIDGIGGDEAEACIDIVMRNPRYFATVVPRERMAALAERYARTHTWSSAADDDDAPYVAATAIVLAAFADDIEAVERMRASREEFSPSVQQAVVPFALRGDFDRVERLLARPEGEDARLAIAINALLDGGHVALARRLFGRVDSPERLDEGGYSYADNGAREMPDITRVCNGGYCTPWYHVAARTLGRLGEEEQCRAMLDRTRRAGGEQAATVNLRWLEFLDGLLTDCDLPP